MDMVRLLALAALASFPLASPGLENHDSRLGGGGFTLNELLFGLVATGGGWLGDRRLLDWLLFPSTRLFPEGGGDNKIGGGVVGVRTGWSLSFTSDALNEMPRLKSCRPAFEKSLLTNKITSHLSVQVCYKLKAIDQR